MQTPLIENIKLNPGVTYIESGRTKLPPTEVIGDKKTMSRRQYNDLYQTQLAPMLKTGLIIEKSPSVSSSESLKNLDDEKKDIMDSIPDYEGINSFDEQIEKVSSSISPVRSQQYGKIRYYGRSVDLSETAGPNERFNAEIVKSKN